MGAGRGGMVFGRHDCRLRERDLKMKKTAKERRKTRGGARERNDGRQDAREGGRGRGWMDGGGEDAGRRRQWEKKDGSPLLC